MSKEKTEKLQRMIWTLAFENNSEELYADTIKEMENQFAEKDKEIERLRQPAAELLHLHLCEQEGIVSGQPTPKQWLKAVDELAKALNPQPTAQISGAPLDWSGKKSPAQCLIEQMGQARHDEFKQKSTYYVEAVEAMAEFARQFLK